MEVCPFFELPPSPCDGTFTSMGEKFATLKKWQLCSWAEVHLQFFSFFFPTLTVRLSPFLRVHSAVACNLYQWGTNFINCTQRGRVLMRKGRNSVTLIVDRTKIWSVSVWLVWAHFICSILLWEPNGCEIGGPCIVAKWKVIRCSHLWKPPGGKFPFSWKGCQV